MAPLQIARRLPAVMAAALLAGCTPADKKAEPTPPAAVSPPAPVLPPPLVDRPELLRVVAAAADAFARGAAAPKAATDLSGRRFAVRLPFGCLGPLPDGALGYAYDEAAQSLRVTARPADWFADENIRAILGSGQTEAIEGFWISRPWIATDACPALAPAAPTEEAEPKTPEAKTPPPAPARPAASPEAVGLAMVFEEGGSRLLRRGSRPYQVVRKAPPPEAGGFRLLLEGRVVADAAGRTVLCQSQGPEMRPRCWVRVEFDRVAMETAGGEPLGEWRS